jgi:hypothetical protein
MGMFVWDFLKKSIFIIFFIILIKFIKIKERSVGVTHLKKKTIFIILCKWKIALNVYFLKFL